MKAPDKIVIFPDDYPTLWYLPDGWETVPSGNVEYIRKDALLEWLGSKVYEYNEDRFDDGFNAALGQVIDKINSL